MKTAGDDYHRYYGKRKKGWCCHSTIVIGSTAIRKEGIWKLHVITIGILWKEKERAVLSLNNRNIRSAAIKKEEILYKVLSTVNILEVSMSEVFNDSKLSCHSPAFINYCVILPVYKIMLVASSYHEIITFSFNTANRKSCCVRLIVFFGYSFVFNLKYGIMPVDRNTSIISSPM